ncbi:PC-Esterase [Corchorus olitorius]|uniref:PC-Esterase n=1 Tax=Corchorus olitorius TaxID=93759 RepID=A0A1R3GS97_9ROSI|nr:PC-Esterase [Corchorus olitorius]
MATHFMQLAKAYGVSIMFLRNAFLVDIVNEKNGRILKLNSIGSGQLWKSVDVVIFNTWHWWLLTDRKQPWDYVQDGNTTRKDMNRMVAYEKALRTWAKWVNSNIDPAKTKVFFQAVSPDHVDSREWADPTAKTCKGETNPMLSVDYPGGPPTPQVILDKVLRTVTKPVHLLNITRLSQLRKDGHPSAFGYGGRRGNDCTHWCLPGVPDIWNQLLYTALLQS